MEDSEKDDLEKALQKPVSKEDLVKVLQDTFRELEMEKMTDEEFERVTEAIRKQPEKEFHNKKEIREWFEKEKRGEG